YRYPECRQPGKPENDVHESRALTYPLHHPTPFPRYITNYIAWPARNVNVDIAITLPPDAINLALATSCLQPDSRCCASCALLRVAYYGLKTRNAKLCCCVTGIIRFNGI
ncbi:MAG: hypothetical protein KJO82_08865, partial [Gammaproteobacteria bacterium]|nr:hypothetical protein [Gammaproteobacteria bacterium]